MHHQYQVRERSHDLTDINQHDRLKKQNFNEFSQSSTFYPSNNIVSENDDKEFQSNHKQVLDLAVAASLVQLPTNPQYVLEQKSILPHANAYNPSYLVMQSKNLLSKYQKFWNGQFKPENGFIDSFFTQKPNQIIQPFIYTKPKFAYTIAQISTSNQHSTTISPITFNKSNILQNNYENLPSEINSITISSKLVDENPSYKIQFASDIDVSKQQPQQDEQNQVKEFHNQMDAGTYHGHQLKNDLILKEAEQNLQKKKYQQQQREHSTLDLQKQAIVEQFKDSILRIVVAEESQLKLSKKS